MYQEILLKHKFFLLQNNWLNINTVYLIVHKQHLHAWKNHTAVVLLMQLFSHIITDTTPK